MPKLAQAQAVVLGDLKRKEIEISQGSESSIALHFFIHFYIGNYPNSEKIKAQAMVDIEELNVAVLQRSIHQFFNDYDWSQSAIANLNAITKVDLTTLDSGKRWFAIDAECRQELRKLKIWREAEDFLKSISEG